MGIGHQNRDLHMFNVLAVENRVNTFILPDDKPVSTVETLQLSQLLPTIEDNIVLRKNWSILTAHILSRYIPQLAFMATHVPKEIEHKYMKEMRKETTVVCIFPSSLFRLLYNVHCDTRITVTQHINMDVVCFSSFQKLIKMSSSRACIRN